MFRALALRLLGDDEHHGSLCHFLALNIFDNCSDMFAGVTGFQNRYQYFAGMQCEGVFVGLAELRAAGEHFCRSVAILQDSILVAS